MFDVHIISNATIKVRSVYLTSKSTTATNYGVETANTNVR